MANKFHTFKSSTQNSNSSVNSMFNNMSRNHNITTMQDCELHLNFKPSYHISSAVFAFVIITVNVFVMNLFKRNRNLRKVPANYLLVSLSVSDLLSGVCIVIHIVPNFYIYFNSCVSAGEVFGSWYFLSAEFTNNLLLITTVTHLILLSTDRFISVHFALMYKSIITHFRVSIAAISCWILGGLLAGIQLVWEIPYAINSTEKYLQNAITSDRIYVIFYTSFTLILTVIILIQYIWLLLLIRRLTRTHPNVLSNGRSCKEYKAVFIYCIMFVSFLIFWVPVLSIRMMVTVNYRYATRVPQEILEILIVLRYFTSIINPALYTLYKHDFRTASGKVIKHFSERSSEMVQSFRTLCGTDMLSSSQLDLNMKSCGTSLMLLNVADESGSPNSLQPIV